MDISIHDVIQCDCPEEFTIEPHGDGFALYFGRCNHRHGYNLINMVEPAWNFYPEQLEKFLNIGYHLTHE